MLFKSNYFNSALNILRFYKSHVLFLIYINFMFIWKNIFFNYVRKNSRHYIKKKPDLSLTGKRYKKHWGPIFFQKYKNVSSFIGDPYKHESRNAKMFVSLTFFFKEMHIFQPPDFFKSKKHTLNQEIYLILSSIYVVVIWNLLDFIY